MIAVLTLVAGNSQCGYVQDNDIDVFESWKDREREVCFRDFGQRIFDDSTHHGKKWKPILSLRGMSAVQYCPRYEYSTMLERMKRHILS